MKTFNKSWESFSLDYYKYLENEKMNIDKYKDNSIVFPDINENRFISSSIEFDIYKNSINEEYKKSFKHFGKPKKYPCVISCSLFKDGKAGAAYYHKISYDIMKRKCEKCGQSIYEYDDNGKTITFAHICNAPGNKILPSPEIDEKKKKDKYPDMGQHKLDIDI